MSTEEKETKDKKKKARKALLILLGKLQKKCGSFKDIKEWYSFLTQNLDPLISQYKENIPADLLKHMEEAKKLSGTTQEAINKACSNLKWNIEKVIKLLPKGHPIAKLLILATVLTSGIVAAAVLYANVKTVTIVVKNKGCDSIYPVTFMPVSIPGFKLFDTPIPNGGQGIVRLFPLPVTVDATQKGAISVGIFGFTLPVPADLTRSEAQVTFNGHLLNGERTTINLSEHSSHELVISCK